MEQVRIVREMRARDVQESGRAGQYVRPRYMVWENVPGAFSSNGGKDFQTVLEEIVKIVCKEAPAVPIPKDGWPKAGCISGVGDSGCTFSACWRLHDSQYWGVPQRRKRIALVADFGGLSAPEILFERKGLSWDFESGKETGKETARANESGAGSAEPILTENNQNYATVRPNVISSDSNGTPHAVCYDARGNGGSEITPTMTGDHQRRITDYTALCIGNGQLNQISMAEQANTLDTMHDQQAVMVAARLDSTVRRFTPLECERLQGYPDGWTDIGEWTDSKGKKHKASDSVRYKALGNSIAVPCWRFILQGISNRCKDKTSFCR